MFVGEFPYKIDEKGRIPIPPPFRHLLTDGVYLTEWADGCIAVFSQVRFQEIAQSLKPGGLPGQDIRNLSRALFSRASNLKLDGQGRVMLPSSLREKADIQETAIVVGVNEYAEIWNPERWRSMSETQDQVWQIIETFEEKSQ